MPDDYLQMNTENSTAIFSPTRPKGDANQSTELADLPDIETTTETSFTFPDKQNIGQHSPTMANNMDINAHKSLRRKNGMPTVDPADQAPEEIPMLHRASSSDGERSPEQTRRFPPAGLKQQYTTPTPSPRHHIETALNGDQESYVNVKPPRKNLNNKSNPVGGTVNNTDAFSNPGYQPLTAVINEKEERRY